MAEGSTDVKKRMKKLKGSMAEGSTDVKKRMKKLKASRAEGSTHIKKQKTSKMKNDNKVEVITVLEDVYNITSPLKVLLDAACFQYMQRHSLTKESISALFPSKVIEFYVTRHTTDVLESLDGSLSPVRAATICSKARCVDESRCSGEAECIISLVKNDNQDKYIVATANLPLHAKLCQMHVPLLRCDEEVITFVFPEQKDGRGAGCAPQEKKKKMLKVKTRNTIGKVPIDWYKDEEHMGYDNQGQKIKKKERPDTMDRFLERTDQPNSWRRVTDELEDEDVQITKTELKIVKKMLKGKGPYA